MVKTKLIGLAGVAGAGKDTFYSIFEEIQKENGYSCKRYAFADSLKKEISVPVYEHFGIDIQKCSREEKDAVRSILTGWGDARRKTSKGTYWFSKVNSQIPWLKADYNFSDFSVVTDVRFKEYDFDEIDWLKSKGGVLIHISQFQYTSAFDKEYLKAQNPFEERNDPKLRKSADFKFEWEQSDNYEKNKRTVASFLADNLRY